MRKPTRDERDVIARRFSDHVVAVDADPLPPGITMTTLIG